MRRIEAIECALVGGGRSGGSDLPTQVGFPLDHYPSPTCPVSRPPPEA